MEGTYSFLVAVVAPTRELWDSRYATLAALFAPGVMHTATVQVRGMAAPKSFQFITEALVADFRTRTVSVTTVAPKPVLV